MVARDTVVKQITAATWWAFHVTATQHKNLRLLGEPSTHPLHNFYLNDSCPQTNGYFLKYLTGHVHWLPTRTFN